MHSFTAPFDDECAALAYGVPTYDAIDQNFFDLHGETQTSATDLLCDNKGAIILTKEPQFRTRTKHIQQKYHYMRDDLVATNQVEVKYITTVDMVADIFTKGLPPEKHWKFTKQLGLAPSLSGSVKTK